MEDSNGDGWPDLSLKTFVEGFSLFTAAAFVLSGFLNALYFWLNWDLNYFSIATPADIVMSGFLYVSAALIIAGMVALHPIISGNVDKFVFNHSRPYLARKLGRLFPARANALGVRRVHSIATALHIGVLVPVLIGILWGMITYAKGPIEDSIKASQEHTKGGGQSLGTHGVNGLTLAADADQAKFCGQAPVLWIGSASIIVNCHGKLRIIQNTQGLAIERSL